jgi:S-layer homology domain
MPRTFRISCLWIGLLTLGAADLAADQAAMEKLRARLKSAEQFGTECCQLLSIPAAAFTPRGNLDPIFLFGEFGFRILDGGSYWAPVMLPSGAVLDNIDLYSYDLEAGDSICATLWAYTGPTLLGSPPGEVAMGSVCSSGSPGYDYTLEPISGTIDNSAWFSGGAQYAVVITGGGGDLWFKGVTIWWHRQVRPAPGSATFNDVPTDHPQFQFIEALVDSGITVGCGSGNYCPDSPLTRGQMAVFLAKALGLYWPF